MAITAKSQQPHPAADTGRPNSSQQGPERSWIAWHHYTSHATAPPKSRTISTRATSRLSPSPIPAAVTPAEIASSCWRSTSGSILPDSPRPLPLLRRKRIGTWQKSVAGSHPPRHPPAAGAAVTISPSLTARVAHTGTADFSHYPGPYEHHAGDPRQHICGARLRNLCGPCSSPRAGRAAG
jgi:hypothetical protein